MNKNETKLTEKDVQNKLIDLGTPPNLLGFTYLTKAIMLVHENPGYIHQVTKALYPEVAKMTETTPSRAERAIRHAIEVTWKRGNTEMLKPMFRFVPFGVVCKPTNSEFIAMLVLKLKQETE